MKTLLARLVVIPYFAIQVLLYPFRKSERRSCRIASIVACLKLPFTLIKRENLTLEKRMDGMLEHKFLPGYNEAFGECCRWVRAPFLLNTPIMLYIHGGGFKAKMYPQQINHIVDIAKRADIGAVAIDYDVVPDAVYPTQLNQCIEAYKELEHCTNRIILAGDSAGGTLVAALCLWLKQNHNTDSLFGVYMNSPWVQLIPQPSGSWKENKDLDWLDVDGIKEAGANYLDGHTDDMLAQPCLATAEDWRGVLPVNSLLVFGDCELFADQCMELSKVSGVSKMYRQQGGVHCTNIAFERKGKLNEYVLATIADWCRDLKYE